MLDAGVSIGGAAFIDTDLADELDEIQLDTVTSACLEHVRESGHANTRREEREFVPADDLRGPADAVRAA